MVLWLLTKRADFLQSQSQSTIVPYKKTRELTLEKVSSLSQESARYKKSNLLLFYKKSALWFLKVRVMAHVNESWHHVTHMNESCHTYEWVMSHKWVSHVTHTNESCHTYEWVMSHTYKWVMSHIWVSHVTWEINMSHIWMSHVTPMNESWHVWMGHGTHEEVMAHLNESLHMGRSHGKYEWIMAHVNESWHIWMSHVTHEEGYFYSELVPYKTTRWYHYGIIIWYYIQQPESWLFKKNIVVAERNIWAGKNSWKTAASWQ